jgi:hypothetical protein
MGLLAAATIGALAIPGSASGATTIGQTAPTAGDVATCGGATLFLTPTVAGAPEYVVPAGGGVLTSWSVQGPTTVSGPPTDDLRLKVVEQTATNTYRIVAEDSIQSILPAVLNTFSTRIPVEGGECIALWVPEGLQPCTFETFNPGDLQEYKGGSHPEPGIGATFVTDSTDVGRRTNVSASLEADADGDGYGDESQDGCPTDPQRQDACTPDTDPPETEITKHPANKSKKPKAKFKFTSDDPGATFECKLKGKDLDHAVKQFNDCDSPRKYKSLDEGKFKFRVRAVDEAGNADTTPAKDKFKVVPAAGKRRHT